MNYKKIEETAEIVDVTTEKDYPYTGWEVTPEEKFIEEVKKAGYTIDDLYYMDLDSEGGILVDYDLKPHEIIWWDKKEKVMKLKMKYPTIRKFLLALRDLGINYDKSYWEKKI